ncbi:hypothetical protein M9Y10_044358 [Tritrichomonas musculus]|uniref:F5/8 type C domain-containing protein n=1 Tax=Tritrichomonas musculus TaxID=1915356 RepID=A0ABR2GPB5_9EUKA
MENQTFIEIKDEFPDTHYFSYKGKKYPIKFDFFKISSNFFSKNQEILEQTPIIPLVEESEEINIEITKENINNFIDFVQHKKVPINKENVISFNYLATRFEVRSLIDITNDYITRNSKEIALDILINHQSDSKFDSKPYESIISRNLSFYIKDERLVELNIPILDRILNEYNQRFRNPKEIKEMKEINDFIFRCLDKHGQSASSLFTYADFGEFRNEYLNKLLNEYSDIFDFHYINSETLKSLYERQSDVIFQNEKQKETFERELSNIKSQHSQELNELSMKYDKEIETMKNLLKTAQTAIEDMKMTIENKEELNKKHEEHRQRLMKEEIDNIKSQHSQELFEMNKKHNSEIESMKKTMKMMQKSLQSSIDDMKSKLDVKEEQNNMLEMMFQRVIKEGIDKIKSQNSQQLIELNNNYNNEIESMKMTQKSILSSLYVIKSRLEINDEQNYEKDSKLREMEKVKYKSNLVFNEAPKIITINRSYRFQSLSFDYVKGREFEGIFYYLNQMCEGNSHLKGIINISSNEDNCNSCYQVIDKDFDQWFYPKMSKNSYIQFNFKERKVSLSQYALKHQGIYCNKLINWEIVGSDDCMNWMQVDERHIKAWEGSYIVSTYPTSNQEFYKYFRIRLKGPSSDGLDYLILTSIEFFGGLLQ